PSIRSRVGNMVPAFGAVAAPCARPGWQSVCPEGPTSRAGPACDMDNGGSGVAVVRWHIGDDTSFEGIEHLLSHRAPRRAPPRTRAKPRGPLPDRQRAGLAPGAPRPV